MILKTVDASGEVKDAKLLWPLGWCGYEGVENVVQVVACNVANYALVNKILQERHPTLFWTPCIAHYLDLIHEHIGNIDWVKKVEGQNKSITKFIYNHIWILNLTRKNTSGSEFVLPSITWFATNSLFIQSLISQKNNLMKILWW